MSIKFEKVGYIYDHQSPFEFVALKEVDLTIQTGKVTAIIGNTGSGKSTLVQHLNALLRPTSGKLTVLDKVISSDEKTKQLKQLRKKVGLVFQFPEYQLFEETILKDVSFGPRNFSSDEERIIESSKRALSLVGMDEPYYERSPLDLSGGQKRRVAIAGILALDPEVLVLDEPTAGLDPQGSKQMMSLFKELNVDYGKTVLIVTHDMDHVLNYCDEVVVMRKGCVYYQNDVHSFFKDETIWNELKIEQPNIIKAKQMLIDKGFMIDENIFDLESLVNQLKSQVKSNG